MGGEYTDVPSPGGWLNLWGVRIFRALVLGTVGTGVAFTLFGTFNGGQALQYCEGPLLQATTKGGAFSCVTPLTESGVVVSTEVFLANSPSGRTRIDLGTASGATYSGSNIMNNVDLNNAQKLIRWTDSGGALSGALGSSFVTAPVVAPSTYVGSAKRYVTGTYGLGSGQVVGGYAGWVRVGIMPCSISGLVRC